MLLCCTLLLERANLGIGVSSGLPTCFAFIILFADTWEIYAGVELFQLHLTVPVIWS